MDRARHHAREHEAAYDAGFEGVAWDEHRDHRADPEDDHQKSLRAAHEQGRLDKTLASKPEIPPEVGHRLRQRDERIAHRRATVRRAGTYLARAGRSVRNADIPTPGGGGTWLGILVGVLALILLFVALNHAGAVATAVSGVANAARWLISPSTLPI